MAHLVEKLSPSPSLHHSDQYRCGDLEGGHLRDLGGTVEQITVESLMGGILPPVNINDTAAVTKALRDKGYIVAGRWSDFPKDPTTSNETEQETFKPLESVVRKILDCAQEVHTTDNRNPTLQFFDNPDRAPTCTRSNSMRPDSYFVRDSGSSHPAPRRSQSQAPLHDWNDIALSAEYKKSVTTAHRNENVWKIIWSMHHTMRNDPCRRFTYGFTIEDTKMRIWFACRTKLYVTTDLNFIQDHERLVRFVIACSYAKEEDLGWDPTIKRIYVGEKAQYDIDVDDGAGGTLVFRTTRILSDFGADDLRGRGTRVFEAHQLNNGMPVGDPVALKDVWVDDDRRKEGQIREQIETDAQGDEDKAIVRKHFLTVLHHGNVMINGQPDNTRTLILRGHKIQPVSRYPLNLQEGPATYREPSVGATPLGPSMARLQHTEINCSHKDHYRIVFKEVGQPVHNMTRLDDTLQTLMDATEGLKLMYKYGWVHRDISSGNVLVHEGVGKLTDLEYAKRMTTEGSHSDVMTGTYAYMSLEAAQCEYLFRPSQVITRWKGPSTVASLPWRYNPLHDLESLWWICLWMILFHRTGPSEADEEKELACKQYKVHQAILPSSLDAPERLYAFMSNNYLLESLSGIPIPDPYGEVALQLEITRKELVKRYQKAEQRTTIDVEAFVGIHEVFVEAFQTAKTSSGDTKLYKVTDIISGTKRGREEEDENHGEGNKIRRIGERP